MRLGVSFIVACALILAGGGAAAVAPKRAVFKVTLSATLTKDWRVSRTVEGDCDETTRSTGHWRLTLRTGRATRIVAIAPQRRGGRVRFSGAVVRSIVGAAQQTGSMIITSRGRSCVPVQRRNCPRERRSVTGASVPLMSPAAGKLRLGRLRRATAAWSFFGGCPEEPVEVRSLRSDLRLADAPLSTADVFARDIPRFFVSGRTEEVTTLEGDVDGTVTQRVRWTVNFTRVAR
jgi:hypothetical protein